MMTDRYARRRKSHRRRETDVKGSNYVGAREKTSGFSDFIAMTTF